MTKRQIEEFAVGYPYSTDYIEILLINNDYNVEKVKEILAKPTEEVIKAVREGLKEMREKRQKTWNNLLSSFEKL